VNNPIYAEEAAQRSSQKHEGAVFEAAFKKPERSKRLPYRNFPLAPNPGFVSRRALRAFAQTANLTKMLHVRSSSVRFSADFAFAH
jgi:hypothetical protein